MGNQRIYSYYKKESEEDKFKKVVSDIKTGKQQSNVLKVLAKPDTRYRQRMLDALTISKFSPEYMSSLTKTINTKISKEELMKTIYALTPIKNDSIMKEKSVLRSEKGSVFKSPERVVVKFDMKLIQKRKSKVSAEQQQLCEMHQQRTIEGRLKRIQNYLTMELDQEYHPFRKLCKTFGHLIYNSNFGNPAQTQEVYGNKEEVIVLTLKIFCNFIITGCLGIYEKWIIGYTQFTDAKYRKWIYKIVMQKIWTVNDNYLHRIMASVLNTVKVPLKIQYKSLRNVTPSTLSISEKLQIGGNYFQSIFQMSQLACQCSPTKLLKQLQIIKHSICRDIDNFHTLQNKGQVFEIDSDNILAIVTFIVCRLGPRIQEIYVQFLILRLIYGENIYFSLDISSYMYSTISGSIEFLQKNYPLQSEKKMTESKLSTDINFGLSVKQ